MTDLAKSVRQAILFELLQNSPRREIHNAKHP